MKRAAYFAKLAFSALFLVVGIDLIAEGDFGPALIGIVLSILLIVWATRKSKKNQKISKPQEVSTPNPKNAIWIPPESKNETIDEKLDDNASPGINIRIEFPGIKIDDNGSPEIQLIKVPNNKVAKVDDYVVLDVETTGLSRDLDKIVEISWIICKDGKIIDRYSSLVNPEMPIPPAASKVNGITNESVKNAPTYDEIRDTVKSALAGRIVVGHNIARFDLAFIKHLIGSQIKSITYIDTHSLTKFLFPGKGSYKLGSICADLGIETVGLHRADKDVEATNSLFVYCKEELNRRSEEEKKHRAEQRAKIKEERKEKFGDSPLYETVFVFTGEFCDRPGLEALTEQVGALLRNSVTGNTDYLVVGNMDNMPEWATKRKLNKAFELQRSGGKVKIIGEAEYMALINSVKNKQ